jgi:hypothetical protein
VTKQPNLERLFIVNGEGKKESECFSAFLDRAAKSENFGKGIMRPN